MSSNNQSNQIIKWLVIIGDFILLNAIIYQRLIGAGEVIRRIFGLTIAQSVLTYVLLRVFGFTLPVGWLIFGIGTTFVLLLFIKRLVERWFVKLYRQAGRNMRSVVFVGSDPELVTLYYKLKKDPALGYNILGYYADADLGSMTHAIEGVSDVTKPENAKQEENHMAESEKRGTELAKKLTKLGSMQDFLDGLNQTEKLTLGDELYLCISRR